MANHISHASLPFPIKNARFTLLVPYLDADGDPTDPTTPDTEVSQDGGAFADAAEEMTTITGSNGMGYITLTGAETNNSAVGVACKVASGPKATLATLYPRNLPILESGTAGAGAAGTITLASGTYTGLQLAGCFIRTTGGTGGGGTGGANNQARRITSYNTSTRVATVTPNWETTPDNTTTYDILLPEGILIPMLTALAPATLARTLVVDASGLADANVVKLGPSGSGTAQTARDIGASVLLSSGTGTGQLDFTSGVVKANVTQYGGSAGTFSGGRPEVNTSHIAGSSVSTSSAQIGVNVVNAGGTAWASGSLTSGVFAAGAINAAAIAADAIGASELAADAVTEIAAAIVSGGAITVSSGGVTVAGYATGQAPLQPTVAGRTLDVSAGGEAGIDWANVGTPGSTVNLSATTVNLTNTLTTYTGNTPQTGDCYARLGAPAGASVSADIAAVQADLPQRITKNTALSAFTFLMVDSSDHVTPKTGLTVTATRSLDGAAFGSCANSVSEIGNGFYKIDLSAGDLNGNVVALKFTASGADQRSITIVTQPT